MFIVKWWRMAHWNAAVGHKLNSVTECRQQNSEHCCTGDDVEEVVPFNQWQDKPEQRYYHCRLISACLLQTHQHRQRVFFTCLSTRNTPVMHMFSKIYSNMLSILIAVSSLLSRRRRLFIGHCIHHLSYSTLSTVIKPRRLTWDSHCPRLPFQNTNNISVPAKFCHYLDC